MSALAWGNKQQRVHVCHGTEIIAPCKIPDPGPLFQRELRTPVLSAVRTSNVFGTQASKM